MAEGKREYVTIFAIGAKLLGSFKGAMTQAQARLKSLERAAGKMGSFFKKLSLGIVGLSAAFAGFAAKKVFSGIFEGAVKQAQEAEDRTRTLTASLMRIEGIRSRGVGVAKQQVDLLHQYGEAMSKQGVVSSDMYDIAAKTLSVYKVTPKLIAQMEGPLADALVSIKGARATEEDMQGLALATGKAIRGGKTKALEEYGFVMNKQQTKEFRDQTSAMGRYKILRKFFASYRGENAKAMNTATGQMQKLKEEQKKMSEELGVKMLPAMGKMAEAWRKLLPEAKPFLETIQNLRVKAMEKLADFIRTGLIPAWNKFKQTLSESGVYKRLSDSWKRLTEGFGKAFGVKDAQDWGKKIGDVFVGLLDKMAKVIDYVNENKDWLLPLVKNLTKLALAIAVIGKVSAVTTPALKGVMTALQIGKFLLPLLGAIGPAGWLIIGLVALAAALVWVVTHWNKFKEGVQAAYDAVGKVPIIGPALQASFIPLKLLIKAIDWLINVDWGAVGKTIVNSWNVVKAFFTGFWDGIKDTWTGVIEWMKTKWNNFAASLHLPSWMKFGAGNKAVKAPAAAAVAAGANIPTNEQMLPAYQRGGVVTRPTVARIGETPELIVPLKVLGKTMNQVTDAVKEVATTLNRYLLDPLKRAAGGIGGMFGVGAGAAARVAAGVSHAGAAAAAAGVAGGPAGAAAAAKSVLLGPEALAKIKAERAGIVKELQAPSMQNLVSATLATEASSAEGQKNVLEAMVNRAVAYKRAGKFKSMEQMIKGGFYGPWNRGETRAVMGRGLSEARAQQVSGMVSEIGAGRNVLRGMTDQGMVNEIKGYKEKIAGEYHGFMQGLHEQYSTAAYTESKKAATGAPPLLAAAAPGAQFGGIFRRPSIANIAERGAEAVIPLTGGRRAHGLLDYASRALGRTGMGGPVAHQTHVAFAPHVEIHGNVTQEETRAMDSRLRDLARDFIGQFKAAQHQERRLSYESGYG